MRIYFFALLLSLRRPLECAMISILLLPAPARAARKTAYPRKKAFLHACDNFNMWPFLVFRFVYWILTETLYKTVFKMPNRRRLTSDEMHVGIGMLEAGLSQRSVPEHLNVSHSVVGRMWNRYQTNGNAWHRHGGGRAKATSDVQDRYIGLLARRSRFRNATSIRNDFQNATNVRVSTQTIRNLLHSAGLMARRPAIRVPVTRYHI